jgi:hypothetical protein
VNNITTGIGETEWDIVDWIGLAQDTDEWKVLVNAITNLGLL